MPRCLSLVALVSLLGLLSACAGAPPCPPLGKPGAAPEDSTKAEHTPAALPGRGRIVAHRAAVHPGLESPDEETVVARLAGVQALGPQGTANVLIEVPAGTIAKFEVLEGSDLLKLEYENGQPRLIDFLPYPANYGAIPKTLVDPDTGGDANFADVILLGPALERGQIVPSHIIGLMKMLDDGEIDHKLLAVTETEHAGFSQLRTLQELRQRYPRALTILQTWFESYKEPGRVVVQGFADELEGKAFLKDCIAAHKKHFPRP